MSGLLLPMCSMFFGLLLIIIFFSKERTNKIENKIFIVMLFMSLIDSVLTTLLQLFGIIYGTYFPDIALNLLNKLDFITLIIYSNCILLYTLVITVPKVKNNISKVLTGFFLVDIATIICIIFYPVSPIVRENLYSIEGPSITIVYVVCAICILLSILITLFNFKKINKKHIPIIAMIFMIIILLVAFKINPYLIIISITLTFLNYIMYFKVEDPDLELIENLKEEKENANKANNAKSNFLVNTSHEIRTPLNSIVGLSEEILTYKDTVPKEVIEISEDIIGASTTLLETIGNIVAINQIETSEIKLIKKEYDVRKEFDLLAKMNSSRIDEKPINFNYTIAVDVPYKLIGDKVRVKQIINNILSNAYKYTNEGTINFDIKAITNDNICNLLITIEDTGCGISKDNLDKLLSKVLKKEDNLYSSQTGLGLSITKRLIDMMGGSINISSEVGKGTKVNITIPQKIPVEKKYKNIVKDEIKNNIEEDKEDIIKNSKILIVDDNELNIKVAKKTLINLNQNIEVDTANSGNMCIEKVKTNKYDLILMDIMMPEKDGVETLKELQKDNEFNIPVIALTADAVSGAKEKYLNVGFTDYIPKPVTKERLKEKLIKTFKKTRIFEDTNTEII